MPEPSAIFCSDCRFWETWQFDDNPVTWGRCAQMELTPEGPMVLGTIAHAQIVEGYRGFVATRVDFGCVMGEPRQEVAHG